MSQVIVRPAEPADFVAIQAIYADAVTNTTTSFELEAPSVDVMRARHERLAANGYPYFVAELDGQLAGYCYAGPFRDRPAYRATVENSVYVDRARRGHGIGGALLAHLIEDCAARRFAQMIAVIAGKDNAASVALHERAGFVRVGTLRDVGRKFDAWHDVTLMQRSLGRDGTDPEASERGR